jgi:TP901 family phage tail tape measure protein
MSDGTVEQDVFLGVDGSQIKAAFDLIDARIAGIQKHIDTIMLRSRQAADAFGGKLQGELQKVNKVAGTIDSFTRRLEAQQKSSPQFIKQQQIDAAYAAIDKRAAESANNRSRQEAQLWAQYDRDRYNSRESMERRLEKVGEERVARLNTVQLTADRERDRLREQNNVKAFKDLAKQQVAEAKGVKELEDIRAASAANIASLRARRNTGTEEERRQVLQMLSVEQDRNKLVEQRLKAEETSAAKVARSDATINQGLNVRDARSDERALAANLSLGAAKARQAEIESRITYQIERTRVATGQEKIEAERLLKVDEARLAVIQGRVRALTAENERNIAMGQKQAAAANQRPQLFGSAGIGGIIARTAAYGGAALAIYSTIGALRDGVDYSIKFQDSIAKLGAISGATSTQQKELAETIAQVGKESRFSTLDLVQAATVLAQAGFDQSEIGESLKGISQLATASGVSIAEATDVVTAAIGAFQLQASDTAHINDVLASALNRTKLNIQQVALGIQYAGATAHENKITFEELTAVMATMANAGIKSGSTIGTGIRQFLVDLQTPTKKLAEEMKHLGLTMKDIDVDQLGLPEVLSRLAAAGFDSAAAYKTLETRAAAAYLVLRNNRNEINEQIIAQNQIGQSAEAAAKGQDSLSAEWQRFKNTINDGVNNGIKPATEAVRDLLKSINDAAADKHLNELSERYEQLFLHGKIEEARAVSQEMRVYKQTLDDLADVEAAHADTIEETSTAYNKASDAVGKQRNVLSSLDDATQRVYIRQKELRSNQLAMQAEVATLTSRFQGLAGYLNGTMIPTWDQLTSAVRAYRLEQLRALGQALQAQAITGRQQADAFRGEANSITQTGLSDGTFARLPKNVQDLYRRVVAAPGNDTLRRQLFDVSNNLPAELRKFVTDFSVALDKGVTAMRASTGSREQLDVVRGLSSKEGQELQAMVSALPGQPDSVIRAAIASLTNKAKGASPTGQKAFAQLIEQAEGYIGSGSSPSAPESKKRGGGHLADRQDRALNSLRLKADEAELENAIKAITKTASSAGTEGDGSLFIRSSRTLTKEQIGKNLDRVNEALDKWVEDRTEQVKDQIHQLKLDPNTGKGKEMMDDLQREIDAKREKVGRDVGEKISKALDIMVDAIDRVAKAAEETADHKLRLAEARVKALDRADLQGKVPDYVRANVQRDAARAADQRDRDQIAVQLSQLEKLKSAYEQISEITDAAKQRDLLANVDPSLKSLSELNDRIVSLKNNTEELKASLNGEAIIPQSFNDAWNAAVQNFREAHNLTQSWADMIKMNLGGAIETVSGAMEDFFVNVISGTMSIREAFRGMVTAIIKYLIQLIAKMIVVKLLQIAIGVGTGSFSPSSVSGLDPGSLATSTSMESAMAGLPTGGFLHGGQIPGALRGEHIRDGVPDRDSVLRKLAKGEFVTRKKAVDSVGVDFMRSLNERGAAALSAFAPKVIVPPPAEQHMNVYVVQEGEKPQLKPNDVLVVIADDIIKGGQTKQLIKHVSQGG